MTKKMLIGLALVLKLGGCSDASPDLGGDAASAKLDLGAQPGQPVVIRFKGVVGNRPFACAETYSGVGGQTLRPADFRFYVQDLTLLTATGGEAPVHLDLDGKWQLGEVALLDFEDKSGDCTGTAEVHTEIRGTVQAAKEPWSGLRFTIGVPFSQNHQDRASAPSPLNLSAMFWSWQSGYKFLRVEGKTEAGSRYVLHLGSTGCVKDPGGQVTGCASSNRATVTLGGFDSAKNSVVVDLAALLAGSDLSSGAECHSEGDKAECEPYYKALGLPFMGRPATQSAFRME